MNPLLSAAKKTAFAERKEAEAEKNESGEKFTVQHDEILTGMEKAAEEVFKCELEAAMRDLAPEQEEDDEDDETYVVIEGALRSACDKLARRGRELVHNLSDTYREQHRRALKSQAAVYDGKKEQIRVANAASLQHQKVAVEATLRREMQHKLEVALAAADEAREKESEGDIHSERRRASEREGDLIRQIEQLTRRSEAAEEAVQQSEEDHNRTKQQLQEALEAGTAREDRAANIAGQHEELNDALEEKEQLASNLAAELGACMQRQAEHVRVVDDAAAAIAAAEAREAMVRTELAETQTTIAARVEAALHEERKAAEAQLSAQRELTAVSRAELSAMTTSRGEAERDVALGRKALATTQARLEEALAELDDLQQTGGRPHGRLANGLAGAPGELQMEGGAEMDSNAEALRAAAEEASWWQGEAVRFSMDIREAEGILNAVLRREAVKAYEEACAGEIYPTLGLRAEQVVPRTLIEGTRELVSKFEEAANSLGHVYEELQHATDELARVSTAAEEQRATLVQHALSSLSQLRRHLATLHSFQLNHARFESRGYRRAEAAGLLQSVQLVERSSEKMISRMARDVSPADTTPRPLSARMIAYEVQAPPPAERAPSTAPIGTPNGSSHYMRSRTVSEMAENLVIPVQPSPPTITVTKAAIGTRPTTPRPISAYGLLTSGGSKSNPVSSRMQVRQSRRSQSLDLQSYGSVDSASESWHMRAVSVPPAYGGSSFGYQRLS